MKKKTESLVAEIDFGQRLRAARREAGKTLKQLAEALGVSAVYVSAVERGRKAPPDTAKLQKIAEFLGLPPAVVQMWADEQDGYVRLPLGKSKRMDDAARMLAVKWDDIGDIRAGDIRRILMRPPRKKLTPDESEALLQKIFAGHF